MPKLILPVIALFICSTFLIPNKQIAKTARPHQIKSADFIGGISPIERVIMAEGGCWGCIEHVELFGGAYKLKN